MGATSKHRPRGITRGNEAQRSKGRRCRGQEQVTAAVLDALRGETPLPDWMNDPALLPRKPPARRPPPEE